MKDFAKEYTLAAETLTSHVVVDHPGLVAFALKKIVQNEGSNIYRDIPKLVAKLQEEKIHDKEIKQVELVLYGSSLVRYLDQLNSGLSPIDINNIILTAGHAGLSDRVARKVVSDILYSLNIPQLAQDLSYMELEQNARDSSVYIPPAAYLDVIKDFRWKIQRKEALTSDELSELSAFAEFGVAAANTLLGQMYLEGIGVSANEDTALEYLNYAVSHGDGEACGVLADYYYGKDNAKTFRLYSKPGALSLNEKRWTKFRNLQKAKQFYKSQTLLLIGLFFILELFMIFFNTSSMTGSHTVALILCSIINCVVMAGIWIIHKKNPFQDLRSYTLPLLLAFFIFAQIII